MNWSKVSCTTLNSNLSKFINYSLDETIIGTWIDGKPIYRKFLYTNQQIPNNTDVSSLNIETIVELGGFVNSYGNMIPIQFNDGVTRMPAYYNSGQKTIVFTPNSDSHVGYMFIEYTKTTDWINYYLPCCFNVPQWTLVLYYLNSQSILLLLQF